MDSDETPVIPGYEALTRLGSGGSGEVWVVRRADGVRLAAKLVVPVPGREFAEQELLQRLDHDHVVRLREVTEEAGGGRRRVLILDLAEGGSLADAIAARRTLTAGELVTVLTPIARTLHDLHGAGLVHADISTGNILFTDAGKPLLADLGVSRLAGIYDEDTWATEAWAAPEVLAGGVAQPASDVWSLGAVAWACVTGAPPPPSVDRPELADIAPQMPPSVIRLIDDAMNFDPGDRPSAGDFALRLWRCAPAQPAPLAGSPGTRRRSVEAEPAALTRRMLRAAKQDDTAPGNEPVELPAGPIGRASFRGDRVFVAALLGVVAVVAVLLAFRVAVPGGSSSAAGAASGVPAPMTRAQGLAGPVGSTPSPARGSATPDPSTTDAARSTTSLQTPSQIVQSLVTARARAWNQEDPRLLGHALAPDSPADRADRAALRDARGRSVDYHGLAFEPGQVSVSEQHADEMTVICSIRRPAYLVTVASTVQTEAPASRRVTLHLVKVDGDWRIHSWA